MTDRITAWRAWYYRALATMATHVDDWTDQATLPFLIEQFAGNRPQLLYQLPTPTITLADLRARWGDAPLDAQVGRDAGADYELRAPAYRRLIAANEFLDRLEAGGNDVYLTANNNAANATLLLPLLGQFSAPPVARVTPGRSFFWIGGDTTTPLHHDLSNNFVWQVLGRKEIILVHPLSVSHLGERTGVHAATVAWPVGRADPPEALRNLPHLRAVLTPGNALHVPVGWWHHIVATGPSITLVLTDYLWPNVFSEGFPF